MLQIHGTNGLVTPIRRALWASFPVPAVVAEIQSVQCWGLLASLFLNTDNLSVLKCIVQRTPVLLHLLNN